MWLEQTPLKHGLHCWVLHLGFPNKVVGEARAGVNNKSRSNHMDLVELCADGEQYILFKKKFRHDTPVLFPDDPNTGHIKMCDQALWEKATEKWVKWKSQYLREKILDD